METQKRFECWLKAVVSQAGTLGELRYRRALVQDELKNLTTRTARESAWLKAKGAPAEALAMSRETMLVLAHQRCLAEQEVVQVDRLIIDVQGDMNESINDLAKTLKLEPLEIPIEIAGSIKSLTAELREISESLPGRQPAGSLERPA